MKRQTIIYVLFLLPSLIFGQLYKCDSTYHNKNFTIWESYKNGLKHGAWEYRSEQDSKKIIKYEEYWFEELVRADTTNIYHFPMFEILDSAIEYTFTPTIKFVLSKLLIPDSLHYFYCEINQDNNYNTELHFFKIKITEKEDLIDHFCSLTNRYIILESMEIPIILKSDRDFANLGWIITGGYCSMVIDKKQRVLEIEKYGW
jgi:hypothetical protein